MKYLSSLENRLAGFYDTLPRLPLGFRSWLAKNLWWLVRVFAIFTVIVVVLLALSLVILYKLPPSELEMIFSKSDATLATTTRDSIIAIVLGIVSATLLFMAVRPLKESRHRGWKLLFVDQIISMASAVVPFFFTVNTAIATGFLVNLAFFFVVLYVLYQIRAPFVGRKLTK